MCVAYIWIDGSKVRFVTYGAKNIRDGRPALLPSSVHSSLRARGAAHMAVPASRGGSSLSQLREDDPEAVRYTDCPSGEDRHPGL